MVDVHIIVLKSLSEAKRPTDVVDRRGRSKEGVRIGMRPMDDSIIGQGNSNTVCGETLHLGEQTRILRP